MNILRLLIDILVCLQLQYASFLSKFVLILIPTWSPTILEYMYGKTEPKLLGRTDSSLSASVTKKSTPAFDIHKSNINSYAFLDEGKKVRLYVDLKGVGDVREGAGGEEAEAEERPKARVCLDWSETSMCLMVINYPTEGESRCLSFGRLHGRIEKGVAKTKKDRVVVTLVKKAPEEEVAATETEAAAAETGEGKEGGDGTEEKETKKAQEPKYEEWPAIAAKGEPEHELV